MIDAMQNMVITVTHGPGLRVPFAAVTGEFGLPTAPFSGNADLTARLTPWLPEALLRRLNSAKDILSWQQWVMHLAQSITELHGRMTLPTAFGENQRLAWIAIGYYDPHATAQAMRLALSMTMNAIQETHADRFLRQQVTATLRLQQQRQPDFQARAMMRAARRLGIPVYPVVERSLVWQYGQGRKAWHCVETSTQSDSRTGMMLQRNKVESNELVRHMGLPGVVHSLATTPQQAIESARRLGYPVVIKPLDQGQGRGVTAGIYLPEDVATAFRKAVAYSPQVIVERFVAGHDYRIMVTGGKFQWAIQRIPPEVVGDGKSSIAELVALRNARITEDAIDKGFAKRLTIDDEVRRVLAIQKTTLEDRPAAGTAIALRGNANVSTGGTFVDMSGSIHPDNRTMAETIARAFRLDSVGVDFLTTDIGRSWRDGSCAVVEVNATPMLFCDAHAEQLIESKFADGSNGRIPTVLLLCDSPASRRRAFMTLSGIGPGIGVFTREEARLLDCARSFPKMADAGTTAKALLFDPDCESIVSICTLNEVRQRGLPLDHFEYCAWTSGAEPDQALRDLLTNSCGKVVQVSEETAVDTLRNLLMQSTGAPT